MRHLRHFLVLVGMMLLATALSAHEPTVSGSLRYVSDYCVSMGGHTGYPALQGSVTVASDVHPNHLTVFVGAWFAHGAGTFGHEVDLYAGLAGRVGRRDSWTLFASWYDLHPVGSEGRGDMIELAARYDHALSTRLTGAAGVRWMQPVGKTPPGEPVPYIEGRYMIPVARRWQLALQDRLSYDCGQFGGDAGLLSRSTLSLMRSVKNGAIDLSVDLSQPLTGIHDRQQRLIVSGGWSGTF